METSAGSCAKSVSWIRNESTSRRVKWKRGRPGKTRLIKLNRVEEKRLLRIDGEKIRGARRGSGGTGRQVGRKMRKDGCKPWLVTGSCVGNSVSSQKRGR